MRAAACALLAAACLVAAASAAATPGGRLNKHVLRFEALTLQENSVLRRGRFTRDLQLHAKPFTISFTAYDREFVVDLEPDTQLFSAKANTTVQTTSGQVWSMEDRRFYRGTVRGADSSFVHLRIALDGTVHGTMRCDDEIYALEPSSFHFDEGSVPFRHVIYRHSDHDPETTVMDFSHNTCQAVSAPMQAVEGQVSRARRAAFDPSNPVCDVALIADFKYYTDVGNSQLSTTVEKMTTRFANVQDVFNENTITVQMVNVGIKIGRLEVVDDGADTRFDPNPSDPGNGNDFLETFSGFDWSEYCLAHLLTNYDFDNGLLGLAYVGSTSAPGGICQSMSGGSTYNTGFSTTRNYGSQISSVTAYLVTAHELGHNFGSGHDSSGGANGNFLMYPVSVDGSRPNNYKFSSQSLSSIQSVVNAKGGCFEASGANQCSNGVQEASEECDCGTAAICPEIDMCCNVYDDSNPGNADNCQLKPMAECSPLHQQNGVCCTNDCMEIADGTTVCREETECVMEEVCDGSAVCAPATPFPDGTICDAANPARMCNDSRCVDSICEIFGLEDVLVAGADACKVTCDDSGTPKTTDQLMVTMSGYAKDRTGSTFTPSSSSPILRMSGDLCKRGASEFGLCNDAGVCEDASGGKNAFNKIEDFIRNLSAKDALDWLQRSDAYIPNGAWVGIGVGVIIILICLCCYCSNKADRKRGIV